VSRLPSGWPNAASSRFVRAGGLDWHVQAMGDGPVLLLLHGTGAATHSWRDMIPLLAQDFTVIAPDLPGHGFTRGSFFGPTLPAVSKAVHALTEALGASPTVIAGHSAGAAVGLRMALEGLADPEAIVALSPALLPFPGVAQHLFPAMAKMLFVNPFAPHIFAQVARGKGTVERFLARSTGSVIDAPGLAAYARLFGTSGHCAGALAMMANWDLVPLKADLPKVTTPVLVLHGEKDAAIPLASAKEAAATIPGAVFEALPGLGHLAHEEAPAKVADRIMAFAAGVSVAAR
jgi:magnesium chelatase accessory protein